MWVLFQELIGHYFQPNNAYRFHHLSIKHASPIIIREPLDLNDIHIIFQSTLADLNLICITYKHKNRKRTTIYLPRC